jgi:catechol 2,3-dioxygenase-like lactoylglutathione lyase family enzyme
MILKTHTILYVDDQDSSTAFYAAVLNHPPRLHVPGMTEFDLSANAVLGLMPKAGVLRLLGDHLADAALPAGLLRAELYLMVDDPDAYYQRALTSGARRVSDLAARDWGHWAAYCLDPDGHVLAFATEV